MPCCASGSGWSCPAAVGGLLFVSQAARSIRPATITCCGVQWSSGDAGGIRLSAGLPTRDSAPAEAAEGHARPDVREALDGRAARRRKSRLWPSRNCCLAQPPERIDWRRDFSGRETSQGVSNDEPPAPSRSLVPIATIDQDPPASPDKQVAESRSPEGHKPTAYGQVVSREAMLGQDRPASRDKPVAAEDRPADHEMPLSHSQPASQSGRPGMTLEFSGRTPPAVAAILRSRGRLCHKLLLDSRQVKWSAKRRPPKPSPAKATQFTGTRPSFSAGSRAGRAPPRRDASHVRIRGRRLAMWWSRPCRQPARCRYGWKMLRRGSLAGDQAGEPEDLSTRSISRRLSRRSRRIPSRFPCRRPSRAEFASTMPASVNSRVSTAPHTCAIAGS